jgi:pyridoxine 4-dehydrogenase
MEYIQLGKSGLNVSRICFGTWQFGGDWGSVEREDAIAAVRAALDQGVTFFDTAQAYGFGDSEALVAEALGDDIHRDDVIVATKGGLRPVDGGIQRDASPEFLREGVEQSLGHLGVEAIDLYQVHWPDRDTPFEETGAALKELKDEGKIRHVGLSNVTEEQLRRAQQLTPIVSIQNRYNLTDRGSGSLVDLCEQEQIAFIPWAPIQGLDAVAVVAETAARHDATDRQVALAWLLARSPSMLVIPGTASRSHLDENVGAAGLTLSPEEVAALSAVGG